MSEGRCYLETVVGSDCDIRRKNEELRAQLAESESRVLDQQAYIGELNSRIVKLQQELREARGQG